MEQEKILEVAVNTGTNLLICGAETYRVEDTIDRICKSYGLECEVFALPTVIVVSVKGEKGTSTICKRIPSRTVDLNKISLLNSLSRNIEKSTPSYDDITGELERISYCRKFSDSNIIFSYSLAAFIYVILFGGNLRDAAVAIPAGILLGLLRLTFSRGSNFPFIEYFVGGLVAGLYSSIVAVFIPQTNPYIIIIGAVINMVPGIALTNGIRDLLHGDSVSGLTRLGEALMTVTVIAAGTGVGLSLWL